VCFRERLIEGSTVNPEIRSALEHDRLIDITTTGRRSGKPSRKEMGFHILNGRIYITGRPGTRDWYANVVAQPKFTFHLKQSAQADLPARATPIVEAAERREILEKILANLDRSDQLETWVSSSPLIAVELLQE
jgi:hypothetical protein